ncbi:MAG: DUF167 family protein [Rhizobiaceae bacterium]|nr:DUF167 family protein [Rhizobiaceae bacterium]
MQPFRADAGGVLVQVRLTPRASDENVTGVETASDGRPHIAMRVRAVPDKGAANDAAGRLLADWLGVPKASVSIAAGNTSRLKTLRVAGDTQRLIAALEAKLSAPVHLRPKRR